MKTRIYKNILALQCSFLLVTAPQVSSSDVSTHGGDIVIETVTDSFRVCTNQITESPFYLEGPGSFTTSTGSVVSGLWGGISLPGILSHTVQLKRDDSIVFIASDGYEMTNSAADILNESDGTWIIAISRDGLPISDISGTNRTVKVGPNDPNILGHTSVRDLAAIRIDRVEFHDFTFTVRGLRHEYLDRQTVQSCVGCHGVTMSMEINDKPRTFSGVPLHRFLAFADDSLYIPHAQDRSIESYQADRAQMGYPVRMYTTKGDSIFLDSKALHDNDRIILAYYRDSAELPKEEAPLVLVGRLSTGGEDHQTYLPGIIMIELKLDLQK